MMRVVGSRYSSSSKRQGRGQTITEVGPALVLLVCSFLLPLTDIAVLSVRYLLLQLHSDKEVAVLALSEKFSTAWLAVANEPEYSACPNGTEITACRLSLQVENPKLGVAGEFEQPKSIPGKWLPNNGCLLYTLLLTKDCSISPLFRVALPGMRIPGLTCPARIQIRSQAHWQNRSIDPETSQYYLNE